MQRDMKTWSGELHIPSVIRKGPLVPTKKDAGEGGKGALDTAAVEKRNISESVGNQTLVFGLQPGHYID